MTELEDGRVLVAGGISASCLFTAEIVDPKTGDAMPVGNLGRCRTGHVAVRLPTGEVLVAGGDEGASDYVGPAEIFDPGSETWRDTFELPLPRLNAAAIALRDGSVLVIGGRVGAPGHGTTTTASDRFDVHTAWAGAGALRHALASLPAPSLTWNGGVVVTAGNLVPIGATPHYDRYPEIFDPASNTWSLGHVLTTTRAVHSQTLLADGRILIAGGAGGTDGAEFLDACEIYDPKQDVVTPTGSLRVPRAFHTAARLGDGRVLVMGGAGVTGRLDSVELYDPISQTWTLLGQRLSVARYGIAVVETGDGRVLMAGGVTDASSDAGGEAIEVYESGLRKP
jgi:N-acetylneuraminic acid mutarotase